MSDRDDRAKRRRVVDAGRRVTEHSSGDRQSLIMPDGLSLWLPKKPGAYRIEIIPYEVGKSAKKFLKNYAEPGDLYYERTYFNHARIGVNNDSYVCAAKTFGKPCPICEHRAALANSPRKEDEETVYALKPKERQLWLIVDHASPDKGVQLWEVSNWCFGKHLDAKINNADEEDRARYRRFADPEEGSTVKLMASEESMGSGSGKFLEFSVDEFRARREPLDPDWLEHGVCLDDVVRLVPYDELKKIFLQTGDADDRDADDRPARGRTAEPERRTPPADDDPPPRKRAAPPPDDEPAADAKRMSKILQPGDAVEFDYRDKLWHGVVVKTAPEREVIHIRVEGWDVPMVVDENDVRPEPAAKRSAPADDDPPPRKRASRDDDESFKRRDDADDDPPPRKRATDDADEPAPKKRAAAGDDDPPPRKRAAPPPDDEPPAKKRAAKDDPPPAKKRASRDDDWDDDEPAPRGRR